MKIAILSSLVVFMVASSAADLEPRVDLTNKPSVTLSVSNATVMVDSKGESRSAREIISSPEVKEASKYAFAWKAAVTLLTLVLAWLATKVDRIPSDWIPPLTFVFGTGIGAALDFMNGLKIGWWDNGYAGMASTAIQQWWKWKVRVPREEQAKQDALDKISRTDQPIP